MREPGFSKERRLQPQITVGLLADETGVPLRAGAFDGNKAETATMIPMINDLNRPGFDGGSDDTEGSLSWDRRSTPMSCASEPRG